MDSHRAVDPPHDHGILDRVIAILHSPEAPSDGGKIRERTPRSRSNRTVITTRSSRDCGAFGDIMAHDHFEVIVR